MGRAPCCDKANVKRGPWSPDEDATLKNYLKNHGTGGLKRCGKSCRLRWLNYLRPHIKHGGFTDEEDRVICTLYATIGSRQVHSILWSLIAAQLHGRTDNDVKNHWNTKLKKKFLAENTNIATNNTGHMINNINSQQFSTFTPHPQVEAFLFDHKNSPCYDPYVLGLDQTPFPVSLSMPLELDVSGFETSMSNNCGNGIIPFCKEEKDNNTQWLGYEDGDAAMLLDFVYEDFLHNNGFVSQDKTNQIASSSS
ncbi:hypothetical protein TanjilG_18261 [Lupinus angustifolius]|uniref:Uncharacterized protein n=1 Tax=Lupinus angustifolius TaxID=3871 RepID=A0A1J7HU50_LUPAN|nr:hypothetical protein TanjilG_18261 [Lupinus angustifolius]